MKVTMILMAVEMVGFAAIRGVYVWENRKRKESFETWDEEQVRAEDRGKKGRRGESEMHFRLQLLTTWHTVVGSFPLSSPFGLNQPQ